MCSGITFLVGLFLLFKGEFRISNRWIPSQQGRTIGLILMAPFVIGICAGALLLPSAMGASGQTTDMDALMSSPQVTQIVLIEFGALIVAIGLTIYAVLSVPPSEGGVRTPPPPVPPRPMGSQPGSHPLETERSSPFAPPPPRPAPTTPPPPEIMTVEQAAAYLGVTPQEILNLIETSQLGAVRAGGSYLIARSAVDDYRGRT
jgi:excisionase family DNA binding protein